MQDGDCPHLLFYGPSGAGKKTLVLALLREIFGAGVERVKVEQKDWKLEVGSRNVEVELVMLSSNYHVEMNPSDVGNKDKYVVQEVIKEMARGRLLGVEGGKGYKVLVLNEVDKLSREAQHALRRTMEQYSATCRLVLICNNISKVLDALRSRTIPVRVPAPSELEVVDLLAAVAEKEAVQLPLDFAAKVAHASDRNMRRALLSLEACKVAQYPFRSDQVIQNTVRFIPFALAGMCLWWLTLSCLSRSVLRTGSCTLRRLRARSCPSSRPRRSSLCAGGCTSCSSTPSARS